MSQVNVSVTFEAKSAAEARKTIAAWKLPEGARVSASMMPEALQTSVVNAKGELVDAAPPAPAMPPPPPEPTS